MDSRYDTGGSIYVEVAEKYGEPAAERVRRAAASGEPGAIATTLGEIRRGPMLSESTTGIFVGQIVNDPFAAPLDSANRQLGRLALNLFKNPLATLALVIVVGVIAYVYVPGARSFFARLLSPAK
jgi:hypothetical protein